MISCIVPYAGQSIDLLRVTVQSALAAGVNEVVIVNDSDEELPPVRNRTVIVAGPRDGYWPALSAGVDAARYEWICALEPGEAMLPERLRQLSLTVAGGFDASQSEWVDANAQTPGARPVMASLLFARSTLDSPKGVTNCAFYPHVTAIAWPTARAADFSDLSAVNDGNRDDSPYRVVEQLNV